MGTAIRAISQDRQIMPLMGVDSRKLYLVTSAIGGGLAGLAAALMVLQYDIYPQIGLQFGPLIFMICVLGGLGNMIGGFIAAFIISQFIAVGLELLPHRMGLRRRLPVLHGGDLHPAAGAVREASHDRAASRARRSIGLLARRRAAAAGALPLRRPRRSTTCTS